MPVTGRPGSAWRVAIPVIVLALDGACGRSAMGNLVQPDASANPQGGSAGTPYTSQPPIDGGQCPEGLTPCGKGDALRCYDLGRSKDHCGACERACAPGIACQAGTCQQYRCNGPLGFRALPHTSTVGKDGMVSWLYRPVLGDFDGDGILDMVGMPGPAAPMSMLYGAGDGTFSTGQVIDGALVGGWQALAADLDGDGLLDLTNIDATTAANMVRVRRGSGIRGASFGEATSYPTNKEPFNALLADFDADGRLDLVVGEASALDYWRGVAGGRFEHQTTLDARYDDLLGGPPWRGPLATDWNGDGILDLVYGTLLSFRLGHGDGNFDPEVPCALFLGAAGDLNNDHRPDLISGKNLLLGLDACHAAKIVPLSSWPDYYGRLALADLSGDGNLDVVGDIDTSFMVRVGDGQGGFAQSLSLSTVGSEPAEFLFGDLDRDGKLDIVYARQNGWGVFLNTCR